MRPEIITFDRSLPVRAEVRSADTVPYHWHDALEVILVLEGEIQISFGPENQRLQCGHVAIFNVEEVHRIYEVAPGSRRLVLVRQPHDVIMDPGCLRRLENFFRRGLQSREPDVLFDRRMEQKRILKYDTGHLAEMFLIRLPQICPVNPDRSMLRPAFKSIKAMKGTRSSSAKI